MHIITLGLKGSSADFLRLGFGGAAVVVPQQLPEASGGALKYRPPLIVQEPRKSAKRKKVAAPQPIERPTVPFKVPQRFIPSVKPESEFTPEQAQAVVEARVTRPAKATFASTHVSVSGGAFARVSAVARVHVQRAARAKVDPVSRGTVSVSTGTFSAKGAVAISAMAPVVAAHNVATSGRMTGSGGASVSLTHSPMVATVYPFAARGSAKAMMATGRVDARSGASASGSVVEEDIAALLLLLAA